MRQIAIDGLPSADTSSRATVAAWAGVWIGRRSDEVRHKSAATDTSAVRRWIVPAIGHRRLEQLTPADVRSVTTSITSAGRSTSTALRAQVVLTKMLRDAVLEGHQIPQRVLMVPAPPKSVSDRDSISLLDAHDILRAASTKLDGSRWVAAFLQGMRQGECLGLTWDCVDLEAGLLDIRWQLDELPYNIPRVRSSGPRIKPGMPHRHLVGRWHLVPPKTRTGTRVIPLVPWMTDALKAWKKVSPKNKWGLVWPSPDGLPQDDKRDIAAWYALQDEAQVAHVDDVTGRRYALHEARHTTATLLMQAGVDAHVVTAIMGHSSIVTTRGYQHVSSPLARRGLDAVATQLGLTPPEPLPEIEG